MSPRSRNPSRFTIQPAQHPTRYHLGTKTCCQMPNRELVIQHPDGTTRSLPLTGHRVSLGRSSDNELAFPDDPILSRRHLAVEPDGAEWWVEDLGSKNGTAVNGEPLSGRRRLIVGDRIGVGRLTLSFVDPDQSDTAAVFFEDDDPLGHTVLSPSRISTNLEQVVGSGASGLEAALRSPSLAGTPRVQALLDAGRELAGHRPLKELFRIILDLATKSVGARRGLLLLMDENGSLVTRAATGDGFHISKAVRDRVLRGKESLLVDDAQADVVLRESHTIVQQGIRSFLAVPLQTQDKVIGLIYADSQHHFRPFTEEDLTLLTVMANVAAIRIENERLNEVEQADRLMKKELEQAAEIQRNLLPREAPPVQHLELAAFSFPCRSVGGDYFDYLRLPGGRFGMLVGDVAGKGLAAALLMSSLQARVQVLADEVDDLALLITRLNASVARTCPGNRFVTFFFCALDPGSGELHYVNAGHNPPYLVRAAAGAPIEELTVGGPVLGILSAARYQSASLRLQPGDVLLMFSDGVTEAQSPTQEEYGEARLLAVLEESRGRTAAEIASAVRESLELFMGDAPAVDDITLVAARRSPFAK